MIKEMLESTNKSIVQISKQEGFTHKKTKEKFLMAANAKQIAQEETCGRLGPIKNKDKALYLINYKQSASEKCLSMSMSVPTKSGEVKKVNVSNFVDSSLKKYNPELVATATSRNISFNDLAQERMPVYGVTKERVIEQVRFADATKEIENEL